VADVVVVLSTPRAGSTWLSKGLRAHPGRAVHGQLTNDNHKLYLATPLRALNPFGDDYVEFDARRSGLSRALRTRLLHALYRSNGAGRTVVLATPSTSVFVPLFLDAFPAARYVHLHRNPLDVVASFRGFMAKNAEGFAKRFRTRRRHGTVEGARSVAVHGFHTLRWTRLPYPGYLATRPRGFQRASRLPELDFLCWYYAEYEREIAAALAHVPVGSSHEVRYEDLVEDFEPAVRGLLAFVGVEAPPGFLEETGKTVRRDSVARYRTSFTEEELDEVRRGLARYGVEVDVEGPR
jgi:hypothetical protein